MAGHVMILAGIAKPLWYVVFLGSSCLVGDKPAVCHFEIVEQHPFESLAECQIEGRTFGPLITGEHTDIGVCLRDDEPFYLILHQALGQDK